MKKFTALLLSMFVVGFHSGGYADFSCELIFPVQEKHVHGSSVVETPDGDLIAAWFYGSGERSANDVLIQGARLRKGDTSWSEVFTMADTPGFPDCNPVLFVDSQERLWLFWIAVLANGWQNSLLKYRRASNFIVKMGRRNGNGRT